MDVRLCERVAACSRGAEDFRIGLSGGDHGQQDTYIERRRVENSRRDAGGGMGRGRDDPDPWSPSLRPGPEPESHCSELRVTADPSPAVPRPGGETQPRTCFYPALV